MGDGVENYFLNDEKCICDICIGNLVNVSFTNGRVASFALELSSFELELSSIELKWSSFELELSSFKLEYASFELA